MRTSSNTSSNSNGLQPRRTTTLDEIDIIEDTSRDNTNNERSDEQDTEVLFGREGRDMSVSVIGALLWPTIASIVGRFVILM